MSQFYRDGFVGGDSLSLRVYGTSLLMQGQIACLGMILVNVTKVLHIDGTDDDPSVHTVLYSYNVSVFGRGTVFRYDNQHPDDLHPGHYVEHHKHTFDFATGNELPSSPTCVGTDGWPTLGEVIAEARDWYYGNFAALDDPHGFVTDLQSELRR